MALQAPNKQLLQWARWAAINKFDKSDVLDWRTFKMRPKSSYDMVVLVRENLRDYQENTGEKPDALCYRHPIRHFKCFGQNKQATAILPTIAKWPPAVLVRNPSHVVANSITRKMSLRKAIGVR